jgi:hypothetical protein
MREYVRPYSTVLAKPTKQHTTQKVDQLGGRECNVLFDASMQKYQKKNL